MLILTRRPGEIIDITLEDGRRIEIAFLSVIGNQMRVGIACDRNIMIDRREITKRKRDERRERGEVNGNVAEPSTIDRAREERAILRRAGISPDSFESRRRREGVW